MAGDAGHAGQYRGFLRGLRKRAVYLPDGRRSHSSPVLLASYGGSGHEGDPADHHGQSLSSDAGELCEDAYPRVPSLSAVSGRS